MLRHGLTMALPSVSTVFQQILQNFVGLSALDGLMSLRLGSLFGLRAWMLKSMRLVVVLILQVIIFRPRGRMERDNVQHLDLGECVDDIEGPHKYLRGRLCKTRMLWQYIKL